MNRGAAAPSIDLLRRAADFERALRTRPRALSAHFAVHHLAGASPVGIGKPKGALYPKLSTDGAVPSGVPVDDLAGERPEDTHLLLGAVVPKRHARRAVTRSLMKRQIRTAFQAQAGRLASGIWLVRLRAGYDRALYPSATSMALRRAVREELDRLLGGCVDTSPAAT